MSLENNGQPNAFFEDPERLKFAMQASGIGIWEFAPVSHELVLNARSCELYGLEGPVQTLSYEQALQCMHPDDVPKVKDAVAQAMNGARQGHFNEQYRTIGVTDGRVRWIRFSGQAFFDEHGHCARFGGIAQETTELIANSERIKEVESLAALALAASNAGSFRILLQTDEIEYSPVFARILTGEEDAKLERGDFIRHIHPDDRDGRKTAYEIAEETGRLYYEARVIWNDETIHWVEVTGTYIPSINGKPKVFTGTIRETTELKQREQAFLESEAKFRALVEQAPVATCLWVGPEMNIEIANDIMIDYWGKGHSVVGKKLVDALPELVGQPYIGILENIYKTGIAHSEKSAPVTLEVNGIIGHYYFDYTYKPIRDKDGKVYAIMNMAIDVTEQVHAQRKLEESEAKLRSVVENAPAAIGLFVGPELRIEKPNRLFTDVIGKGEDLEGKPLHEVLTIAERESFLSILNEVYAKGEPFKSYETPVAVVANGATTHRYFNINFTPLFDERGKVYAILDVSIDVTERVLVQREIEASRLELLALFEQSPVAIAIINKDQLTFKMANPFFAELIGRKPEELIGKPMMDAVPELVGQGFDDLLYGVLETGKPFTAREVTVELIRNHRMETIYVDLSYQPQRERDQSISGILIVAMDVTEQVLSRRKIEEAEAELRNAVEVADLATWSIEAATGTISYDRRMKTWIGVLEDDRDFEEGMNPVPVEDRERISQALEWAISPDSDGIYNEVHVIEHVKTGRRRIIHAQATRYLDSQGRPVKLAGTARDITIERELQMALEQEVRERTEELATNNEELQVLNEELADTNNRLLHSNEELAQYAYVASHDLQEPLRKIRMFSGMLGMDEKLSPDSMMLVSKIAQSSERMTLLIRDLLEFSRLLKSESLMRPVDLRDAVTSVINDFELIIEEKNAQVSVGELPTIVGINLQINQLFYNLLANALKFSKVGVPPVIEVKSAPISREEVAVYLPRIIPGAQYHHITISDNGIGFNVTYAEKIFEVFQRLHGRDAYPGSGIGLALCRRIVGNHNGSLYAASAIGEGSVFHVILPDIQEETGNSIGLL